MLGGDAKYRATLENSLSGSASNAVSDSDCIAIYFVLMSGDFDQIHQFPFNRTIRIEIQV